MLLHSIERGNCVLVLGPDMNVPIRGSGQINLSQELRAELAGILEDEDRADVGTDTSLSLVAQIFENEMSRDDLEMDTERFYTRFTENLDDGAASTLDHIARLPFRTFITLHHDLIFESYLQKVGKAPRSMRYDINGYPRDNLGDVGSVDQPLVYHMFGSIDEPKSLILTDNDIIRFIEAVVSGDPKLPDDLTNELSDKNFVFFGFGIGNYYLRILLRSIGLSKSVRSFAFEQISSDDEKTKSDRLIEESVFFYKSSGYKSLKIMQSELQNFAEELDKRWTERFPDGISLSTPSAPSQNRAVQPDAPSVFISFVSEDRDRARRIAELFRSEGLDPWFDEDGLRVGVQWEDRITDAIRTEIDFFVLLQSDALDRQLETYVHKEVKLALERQEMRAGRFIFPVIIDQGAQRMEVLDRARIQSMDLCDPNRDLPLLAKEIRREFARQHRR